MSRSRWLYTASVASVGPSAITRRPLRWLITPSRRIRIEEMFAKRGKVIVFMGRHMAGLRAPIFAMAGINGVKLRDFWLYDGLGLCISAPVVIGIGYALADQLDNAKAHIKSFELAVMGVLALAIIGFIVWRKLRRAREIEQQ